MNLTTWLLVALTGCSATLETAPPAQPDGGQPPDGGHRVDIDISRPTASAGMGDIHGLAISGDRSRAYVGEGAQIAILDLTTIEAPDATPYAHPRALAKVPIEAQVITLAHDDHTVFVAGGAFGVLAMDAHEPAMPCAAADLGVAAGCFPITAIDTSEHGAYALDVAVAGGYLLAVFGAVESLGGSELRIYDRSSYAPVRRVPLTTGIATASAYALEVAGDDIYIAAGTGGVLHASLQAVVAGGAASGARVLDPANPPAGCQPPALSVTPPETARVRDVALAGGALWVAADTFGLVELDPATLAVRGCTPLSSPTVATDRAYAVQVEAVQLGSATYVVVNGNGCSKGYEGGAPYSMTGRMTYDLGVGGEVGDCSPAVEAQFVFAARAGGLAQVAYHPGPGDGGGNFVARAASATALAIYEQPVAYAVPVVGGVRPGLIAYTVATDPGTWPAPDFIHIGHGLDAFGAFPLLGNPNFVVPFFEGSSGSQVFGEYLDLAEPSAPRLVPPSADGPRPDTVLVTNAQWLEASEPGKEWFTSAYNYGLELVRTSLGSMCQVETFPLATPQDAECRQPRVYYSASAFDGDEGAMLLTTRSTSRWGAVLYNRDTLVARANATTPGCQLYQAGACETADTCSLDTYEYQIDTHPELEGWDPDANHLSSTRVTLTWDSKTFDHQVGGAQHRFAVIAAGFDANNTDADHDGVADDPDFSKPQIVVVDLDAAPTIRPGCASRCGDTGIAVLEPVATVRGPSTHGDAFSVELVEACDRRYAFVGDFGGRILVFELSDPYHPAFVTEWVAPPNPLDGHYDNLLSVLADYDAASQEAIVYASGFRSGLAKLRVGVVCSAAQPLTFPASDWAAPGVERAHVPGLAHMLRRYDVGDKHGLILGAKNGGVRFYGEFANAAASTCGP